MKKYECPVCGNLTLDRKRAYEDCDICGWEDDPIQFDDPDLEGGANAESLTQAREAYKKKLREKSEKIF